jgi:hypothetical protein
MDILYETQISIPIYQICLLLLLSTLSLLFGRVREALFVNYLFTLYWGYISNRQVLFGTGVENMGYFTFAYFGFGLLIIFLALAGFLSHRERK